MEAKPLINCDFPPSGSIFFQDDWNVIYRVNWDTIDGLIDITTVTESPVVFDGRKDAFFRGNILFRLGTITVLRQVIRVEDEGFIIIAEGSSQIVDFYQANFICGEQPIDNFCYHLDCAISDETDIQALCGPRWTDPDDPDVAIVWGELTPDSEVSVISGLELFQWDDVWTHDIDMTGVDCDATASSGIIADQLSGLIFWIDILQETTLALFDQFTPIDFSPSMVELISLGEEGYYDPDGFGIGHATLAFKTGGSSSGSPVDPYITGGGTTETTPVTIDLDKTRFTILLVYGEITNSLDATIFELAPLTVYDLSPVTDADLPALTIQVRRTSVSSGATTIYGVDGDLITSIPFTTDTKRIISLRYDGDLIYISINGGEEQGFDFDGYDAIEALGLAARIGSTILTAELAELIIYNEFKSNSELAGLLNELSTKHDITLS